MESIVGVQHLNTCQASQLSAIAVAVLGKLSGSSSRAADLPADAPLAVVDAVSMFLATALQRRLTPAELEETASAVGTLRREALNALLSVYKSHHASVAVPETDVLQDGFLPQLTGSTWTLQHALGDRTKDPPQRSLPLYRVAFHTSSGESKVLHVPLERLVDLQSVLHDMVKEADRVTGKTKD